MTTHLDPTTWGRICDLAANGPKPGESLAEIDAFLTEAERMVALAKALTRPGAVSPAKRFAQMQCFPITPKDR